MATDRTVLGIALTLVLIAWGAFSSIRVFKHFRRVLKWGEEEARENPRPW